MSTPYSPIPIPIESDKVLAEAVADYHLLVETPSLADALAALGFMATVYSTDLQATYPSDVDYTHLWIDYHTPSVQIQRILAPINRDLQILTVDRTIEALARQSGPYYTDSSDLTYNIHSTLSTDSLTALLFLADRVKRARQRHKRTELLTLIDLWRSLDPIRQIMTVTGTRERADISSKEWQTIANVYTPKPDPDRKTSWTAAEILKADFPEPEFIVLGLIPNGLTIFAGRPKSGKSFFALQLAIAVANGSLFLGRPTRKCKVLYCALEDSPRRIQQRMLGQGASKHIKQKDLDITYEFEIPPLSGPGAARIYERVQKENFGLIIIDTFTRAAGRADQMDQVEMAACMNALHQIALKENIAIIIIDHHRKNTGFSGDVIDDILGATSKSGVVDTAIGIYNNRGSAGAVLKATGRDIDETINLAISFDEKTLHWTCEGPVDQVIVGSVQNAIIEALDKHFDNHQATTAELAEHLTKDRSQISRDLKMLVEKGVLYRCPRQGKEIPYRLSDFIE